MSVNVYDGDDSLSDTFTAQVQISSIGEMTHPGGCRPYLPWRVGDRTSPGNSDLALVCHQVAVWP